MTRALPPGQGFRSRPEGEQGLRGFEGRRVFFFVWETENIFCDLAKTACRRSGPVYMTWTHMTEREENEILSFRFSRSQLFSCKVGDGCLPMA